MEETIMETTSEQRELMDAVNEWKSAECFDCGAHFGDQSEAFEHDEQTDHLLLHRFDAKGVN